MTKITASTFGKTCKGEEVVLYTLDNGTVCAGILNYGGILQFLKTPDKNGKLVDIVLGHDDVEGYEQGGGYIGAVIGRYANRIGDAQFTLNGTTYQLYANDGAHHLHGGKEGFDRKIWSANTDDGVLTLTYISADGEEGYPGKLTVSVTYSLSSDNTLTLDYCAISDKDTICNLTNHTYFNLGGQDSGAILDQTIQVFADQYTPTDIKSIPHGEIASVEGTPMDLRQPTVIGKHIDDSFEQLVWAGGYDHNWVVEGTSGELRKMAYAFHEATGITLTGYTTLPGVQFYSGNYLDGLVKGKGTATNERRCGFCLESQYFPNSINCPNYPQPVLKAGEGFHQVTSFRLGLL